MISSIPIPVSKVTGKAAAMNSFKTVSLVLAVLIATCTARTLDFNNNYVKDPSSSSEEILEFDVLTRQLQATCYEKTGSNQAFTAMTDAFAAVPHCFLLQFDVINFADDLNWLNASTRHEFFPKYCPQFRNALPCFDSPIIQISKCLDDDSALVLLAMLNAAPEALELICQNDGELLFSEGATYDVCMQNYANYAGECASLVSDSKAFTAIAKYDETQCQELAKARDCMQGKLNECNGPRLMDVLDVFWRAVMKNTPCRSNSTSN